MAAPNGRLSWLVQTPCHTKGIMSMNRSRLPHPCVPSMTTGRPLLHRLCGHYWPSVSVCMFLCLGLSTVDRASVLSYFGWPHFQTVDGDARSIPSLSPCCGLASIHSSDLVGPFSIRTHDSVGFRWVCMYARFYARMYDFPMVSKLHIWSLLIRWVAETNNHCLIWCLSC